MRISDWSSDVCSSDLFTASPFISIAVLDQSGCQRLVVVPSQSELDRSDSVRGGGHLSPNDGFEISDRAGFRLRQKVLVILVIDDGCQDMQLRPADVGQPGFWHRKLAECSVDGDQIEGLEIGRAHV